MVASPEAELDVTAAALLRTALAGPWTPAPAVEWLAPTRPAARLHALAARGPAKVVALTFSSGLDTDDDLRWAKIAHQSFPSVEHVVLSPEDIPGFYAGLDGEFPLLDEPSVAMLSTPRILSRLHTARAHGSRLHMDGLGGDQLLTGSLSLYHDLLWQRPWTALPLIRGHRLLAGLSLSETFASLADRRDLRAWLADIRHSIATGEPPRRSLFGWDVLPKCGPWLTAEARERVAEAVAVILAEGVTEAMNRFNGL